MRASLHFSLPDEADLFEQAQNAYKYWSVIMDFDNFLRQKIKYTEQQTIELQEVRDKLWEIVKENGLEGI